MQPSIWHIFDVSEVWIQMGLMNSWHRSCLARVIMWVFFELSCIPSCSEVFRTMHWDAGSSVNKGRLPNMHSRNPIFTHARLVCKRVLLSNLKQLAVLSRIDHLPEPWQPGFAAGSSGAFCGKWVWRMCLILPAGGTFPCWRPVRSWCIAGDRPPLLFPT